MNDELTQHTPLFLAEFARVTGDADHAGRFPALHRFFSYLTVIGRREADGVIGRRETSRIVR